MDAATTAIQAFVHAIEDLERCLAEGRWDEAGEAATALALASSVCAERGVQLSPDQLEQAEAAYSHCVESAIAWGRQLQSEAQAAGASNRAAQSYGQG